LGLRSAEGGTIRKDNNPCTSFRTAEKTKEPSGFCVAKSSPCRVGLRQVTDHSTRFKSGLRISPGAWVAAHLHDCQSSNVLRRRCQVVFGFLAEEHENLVGSWVRRRLHRKLASFNGAFIPRLGRGRCRGRRQFRRSLGKTLQVDPGNSRRQHHANASASARRAAS
jgi:hypothetical protein